MSSAKLPEETSFQEDLYNRSLRLWKATLKNRAANNGAPEPQSTPQKTETLRKAAINILDRNFGAVDLSCLRNQRSVPQKKNDEESRDTTEIVRSVEREFLDGYSTALDLSRHREPQTPQFPDIINISGTAKEDDTKPSTSAQARADLMKRQYVSQNSELTTLPQKTDYCASEMGDVKLNNSCPFIYPDEISFAGPNQIQQRYFTHNSEATNFPHNVNYADGEVENVESNNSFKLKDPYEISFTGFNQSIQQQVRKLLKLENISQNSNYSDSEIEEVESDNSYQHTEGENNNFLGITQQIIDTPNDIMEEKGTFKGLLERMSANFTEFTQTFVEVVHHEKDKMEIIKATLEKIEKAGESLSEEDLAKLAEVDFTLTILEHWKIIKVNVMNNFNIDGEGLRKIKLKLSELENQILEDYPEFEADSLNTAGAADKMDVEAAEKKQPNRKENTTSISENICLDDISNRIRPNKDGMVIIGINGTLISEKFLKNTKRTISAATLIRKILVEVFGRESLSTHTLSGRPSPAFVDRCKPEKGKLDPLKIDDIIEFIMAFTKLRPRDVRAVIVAKCAEESKMKRIREKENQDKAELHRKNVDEILKIKQEKADLQSMENDEILNIRQGKAKQDEADLPSKENDELLKMLPKKRLLMKYFETVGTDML